MWSEATWRNQLDELRLTACTLPWLGDKGLNYQFTMVRLFELLQEWPEFQLRATYSASWWEIQVSAQHYSVTVNVAKNQEKWRVVGPTWKYIGFYPDRRLKKWLESFEQFREERIALHAVISNALGRDPKHPTEMIFDDVDE